MRERASGGRAPLGRWSTAITGAPAAVQRADGLEAVHEADVEHDRGRQQPARERAAERGAAGRRSSRPGARPAVATADAVPDLVEGLHAARARGPRRERRAPRCARARSPAVERAAAACACTCRSPVTSSICTDEAARARLGIAHRDLERVAARASSATAGGGVVAHERRRACSERLPGHVARPERRPCAGRRRERARVEARLQEPGDLGERRRRRSRRPRRRSCRRRRPSMSKRAESPTGWPAAGGGRRPTTAGRGRAGAARARDLVGARAARRRARSPISSRAIVSGSLGWPGGAVALHQQRGRARGVRRRGRRADHRDARARRWSRPARPASGLSRPSCGRALRGVRRPRRRPSPVARADRERARARRRASGCSTSTVGLVAEVDAAAEDLEVADGAAACSCRARSP